MTCIVGIKDKDIIYMGADSLGSTSFDKSIRKDKKIFRNGEMLFGFTTSFRMGQILQYAFTAPEHPKGYSDFKYLVEQFIPAVIKTYRETSYLTVEKEKAFGGTFLLGYRKNLYQIENDFQVAQSMDNYAACGCGESFAMGSLYTTRKFDMTPKERIELAIKAAAEYSVGVGGPIHILQTGE